MRPSVASPHRADCPPTFRPSSAAQLCDLYENDCIFDKFDCSISGDGKHFCTGTYSNFFR